MHVHAIGQKDILVSSTGTASWTSSASSSPTARRWPGFATLIEQTGDNYNDRLPKYGIGKDPEPFRRFARAMRERGLTSLELDGILDAIWRTTN